jgi:hypothetical protein
VECNQYSTRAFRSHTVLHPIPCSLSCGVSSCSFLPCESTNMTKRNIQREEMVTTNLGSKRTKQSLANCAWVTRGTNRFSRQQQCQPLPLSRNLKESNSWLSTVTNPGAAVSESCIVCFLRLLLEQEDKLPRTFRTTSRLAPRAICQRYNTTSLAFLPGRGSR